MERIVASHENSDEQEKKDLSSGRLRPKTLKEFVGQEELKKTLSLFIAAAHTRSEALDHVLLAGPPGLGKTTLAHIIACEMKSQLHVMTGPNVERKADLATVLSNLQPHDVVFIDEIHRLQPAIEEVLYSAMEDFKLDLILGQGPSARTLRIDLPPFTLIGATTRSGLLTNPFRDRFGIHMRLEFYSAGELLKLILRSASLLGIEMDDHGAHELAIRCRGTPRVANRLLRRVRDFAQVRRESFVSMLLLQEALQLFEVDGKGLDSMDRKLLRALIEKFDGGPVGIESLASALSEEPGTLEDVYEPYLLQQGFIIRTPRGRVAGPASYEHLGIPRDAVEL